MTVSLQGGVICLEGPCRLEEAAPLLALLREEPGRSVDLSAAGSLHTAVFQVLLAFLPPLIGEPRDPFTSAWLAPLLTFEGPG